MAFVELTEGELEPAARAVCESTLFARLEASSVAPEMVAINAGGCFFTVYERDLACVRAAAASLNVALRLRRACARVTLARAEADWPLPSLSRVLVAIGQHGLEAIHITADTAAVHVVVAESDVGLTSGVLAAFCQPKALRPPLSKAIFKVRQHVRKVAARYYLQAAACKWRNDAHVAICDIERCGNRLSIWAQSRWTNQAGTSACTLQANWPTAVSLA